MASPIRPTDDEARDLAQTLIREARTAALAVTDEGGAPFRSRIGFGTDPAGSPLSLVSQLSQHTRHMAAGGPVSLLVGEPGPRGDPLNHPRLTLQARPVIVPRNAPEYEGLASGWCELHPKARLYVGFADFLFVRFQVSRGFLNGGFGKAFDLTPSDMALRD